VKSKNVPPSSGVPVVLTYWLISYSGELCNNNVSSRLPRRRPSEARFVTLLSPISDDAMKHLFHIQNKQHLLCTSGNFHAIRSSQSRDILK